MIVSLSISQEIGLNLFQTTIILITVYLGAARFVLNKIHFERKGQERVVFALFAVFYMILARVSIDLSRYLELQVSSSFPNIFVFFNVFVGLLGGAIFLLILEDANYYELNSRNIIILFAFGIILFLAVRIPLEFI